MTAPYGSQETDEERQARLLREQGQDDQADDNGPPGGVSQAPGSSAPHSADIGI